MAETLKLHVHDVNGTDARKEVYNVVFDLIESAFVG
jgi:hypothetical protein